MGCCASNVEEPVFLQDFTPFIVSEYKNSLEFRCVLSSIKVRGIDSRDFRLKLISHCLSCEVSTNHTNFFDLELSASQLNQEMLTIAVFSSNFSKSYGKTRFMLAPATTGPIHFTFPLTKLAKTVGRISFNLELLQQTLLEIQPISITAAMQSKGPYRLTCKLKGSKVKEVSSDLAEKEASWKFDQTKICSKTTMKKLQTSALHFLIWREAKNTELLGECWMNLARTVQNSASLNLEFIDETIIQCEINETLWKSGKRTGSLSGTLQIKGVPSIYQALVGVHTESGIQLQSSAITEAASFLGNSLPKPMKSMASLTNSLKQKVHGKNTREFARIDASLEEILLKLVPLLSASDKESMVCFVYESVSTLTKAQCLLLELSEHLVTYANFMNHRVRPLYFKCLHLIFKRGELDIGNLAIDSPDRNKVVELYKQLEGAALSLALTKLSCRGLHEFKQHFVEFLLAISVFRVPQFRQVLGQVLKKKSFYRVPEWRGVNFSLDTDELTPFLPTFDWERVIYTSNAEIPVEFLESRDWQERMEKRGIAFFRFVVEYCTYIHSVLLRNTVDWTKIPGYVLILKVFLIELRERDIELYPEALVEASCAFLKNSSLLNSFLTISFHKANLYKPVSVVDCMELLDKWLSTIYSNGEKTLPATLDLNFFIEGMSLALCDDFALVMAKALSIIYRHLHLFPEEVKQKLVLELVFQQNFNLYFHHWCPLVRKTFFHVILYRALGVGVLNFDPVQRQEWLKAVKVEVEDQLSQRTPRKKDKVYETRALIEFEGLCEEFKRWSAASPSEFPTFDIEIDLHDEIDEELLEEW